MTENLTLLSLLATAIVLTLLAYVYFYYHLKALRQQLDAEAYRLYFAATGKADLLPLAIEKWKSHNPDYSFAPLIEARRDALSRTVFDGQKRQLEDRLWQLYEETLQESKKWPSVRQDHLLSSVGRRLKEADLLLERARESYNRLAGRYNKIAGNFLLKPASLAANAKKRSLF